MKIAALIARILLGLAFLVFGLNGFLNFLPPPKNLPAGLAGQFIAALVQSRYFLVVAALQVVSGALFLVNRYVPLALTLLGPVIVNILLYHLFIERSGILPGCIATILWGIVALQNRQHFAGLFVQRTS